MSLLKPTQIQLTPAQTAAAQIKSTAAQTYAQLSAIQKRGIQTLWHNPQATPQQVCDALGVDAAKVFAAHGALTDLIVSLATVDGITPDIALPTKKFTVNQNGTITVGTEAYVAPTK